MNRVHLSLAAGLAFLISQSAHAVQVAGNDGFVHDANPGDGTPWQNVGSVGIGSCVYLGSYATGYWAISAVHVGGTGDGLSVTLNGNTYSSVNGSGVRLTNPGNVPTDLMMFRLSADPGLANLTINSQSLTLGTSVRMIGNGVGRAANLTYWNSSWAELPGSAGASYGGYKYSGPRVMAWGDNTISNLNVPADVGHGPTTTFGTTFDAANGETQVADGDSGGGAFIKDAQGNWLLAGVLDAKGGYANQPANTSVFGDGSYSIDLSVYHAQIQQQLVAVPEPSTYALVMGGASLAVFGIRRRRRAAR